MAMAMGILEVQLVDAKGLSETDFLSNVDPYVVIKYRSQEHKSSVSSGSNPVWNERFSFRVEYPVSDMQYKLTLNIMDKDTFSADDFVGQATIHLKDLLASGVEKGHAELHAVKYRVIGADQSYCGEIRIGVTFSLTKVEDRSNSEMFGGWKESEY